MRPKPMVEIGGLPILWHIMRYYAQFGFTEFAGRARLQGRVHQALVRRLRQRSPATSRSTSPAGEVDAPRRDHRVPDWQVDLIDTGQDTNDRRPDQAARSPTWATRPSCSPGATACPTSISTRCSSSTGPTASWPRSPRCARRPASATSRSTATGSSSSPRSRRSARAGSTGPSSCSSPQIFDYIDGDDTQFEREPLERLAADGQLMAYQHDGFWQCMDTMRDKKRARGAVGDRKPPWKTWE